MPNTSAVMPSVDVTAPATSKRPGRLGVSAMKRRAASDQADADRHVDEEAEPPRDQVRDQAAQHQADAGADAGGCGVVGERARAVRPFGEVRGQQGQCRWREDRRADALHRARAEQPGRATAPADRQRSEGEQRRPAMNMRAPEDVAGARAQQQQSPEHQRVRVLHPGQAGRREAQALLDLRQPVSTIEMSITTIR
jgi:hypothetical protein